MASSATQIDDIVVMDDFLYATPVPEPSAALFGGALIWCCRSAPAPLVTRPVAQLSCASTLLFRMSTNPPVDETKLNEFMGKALADMGAAMNAALVLLGDE